MDEKYPRFIRGLNWTYTDSNGNVIDGIEIDKQIV
jgi:hypothetical protein